MKRETLRQKLIQATGKSPEAIDPILTHIHISLCGVSGSGGVFGEIKIPSEYNDYFLFNSPSKDTQKSAHKKLTEYSKTYGRFYEPVPDGEKETIKSVYLWSDAKGNGKTSTACALLNEFVFTGWQASAIYKRPLDTPPAYFFDLGVFQGYYNRFSRQGIAQDIAEKASREYYEMMDKASTAPLVVFDDIGLRSATEAFRADLHTVINKRMMLGLPSIYTSNVPLENLETIFDERLADRVRENCVEIHFEGGSKRGIHK